ncbi:ATP-dependent DNA helicase Q-like 3 [Hypsizygus marmoreus]|uniref:DNA 3'-5' helicase n=1 Tax=Hypsizygus marmoreus TaxID=39966 RepID=A0A369JIX9_HYPMA|nr:ATP-dependent DNA helicase Q-like 3 [Hypsizygus marmoreus]
MLLLGPEQLSTRDFELLLQHAGFTKWMCGLGVDEIHLLNSWGAFFRPAFQQIRFIRARLPDRIPLIAVTATLQAGASGQGILSLLGLHPRKFHLLQRSNVRADIQLLFRELVSGIEGSEFPELDWILRDGQKTIIFATTIKLGFNLKSYFTRTCPASLNAQKYIRLYNALNFASFNTSTRDLIRDDECRVIIGTNTLAVGMDLPDIQDVVLIGEPQDVDNFFQKIGRVGRDKLRASGARGIVYVSRRRMAVAEKIVSASTAEMARPPIKRRGVKGPDDAMDRGVASLLVADCIPAEQNRVYNNPLHDKLCDCTSCHLTTVPPPSSHPVSCNCSGCLPENLPKVTKPRVTKKIPGITTANKLTDDMRDQIIIRLEEFRLTVWEEADEKAYNLLPPSAFLPTSTITSLVDRFPLITAVNDVYTIVHHIPHLKDYHERLYNLLCTLRTGFNDERMASLKERDWSGIKWRINILDKSLAVVDEQSVSSSPLAESMVVEN